ncbi:MAG: iron-containing alcohol dehydrogenase [Thalassovita sp.]
MEDFIFNTTPSIFQKWGGAAELATVVRSIPSPAPLSRLLFVTDPGILQLGLADKAMASLAEAGFDVCVFSEIEPDPKALTVENAVDVARSEQCDCVVGFGGGSSMDVAKVVALMLGSDQPMSAMFGVNQAKGLRLPLVLVPTTAGTGSEVTPVSILTTGTEEKKGIVSPLILPDVAVLDAELTVGLPPAITAATGVDAMVHAIEAFTSKSANNNPISRHLAKQALLLLGANIQTAVHSGTDRTARSNMLLGSMLAGQAFANSPVAAVHALAYPIGSLFHVPHGLSNALVLREVMRFNAPNAGPLYAELAPLVFPDIRQDQPQDAQVAECIEKFGTLTQSLGLEPGLRSVGIKESDIARLASDAMNQTRLLVNNPRDMTEADATAIYLAAL